MSTNLEKRSFENGVKSFYVPYICPLDYDTTLEFVRSLF